jgi:hypothetical protein
VRRRFGVENGPGYGKPNSEAGTRSSFQVKDGSVFRKEHQTLPRT